jgi:hypothetical protein
MDEMDVGTVGRGRWRVCARAVRAVRCGGTDGARARCGVRGVWWVVLAWRGVRPARVWVPFDVLGGARRLEQERGARQADAGDGVCHNGGRARQTLRTACQRCRMYVFEEV